MKLKLSRLAKLSGDALMLVMLLSATAQAQPNDEERQATMEERRAQREEIMRNNPDAAQRMEQRRERRGEFLENNPDAAARMEERRARMEEFRNNNPDARPPGGRRGPGFGPPGEGPRGPREGRGAPPGAPQGGEE